MKNLDEKVVKGFGEEWKYFDQSQEAIIEDLTKEFEQYFEVFPWDLLPDNAIGADIGCGSGRWAKFVAPKVGKLYCCDPAIEALKIAKKNLSEYSNCIFINAPVDHIPLERSSLDFAYSLGVLHHIPDTAKGIESAVSYLKPGSPFLLYLYYSFDNRPFWFKMLHKASDIGRFLISKLNFRFRLFFSQIIAVIVYFPLSQLSLLFEKLGFNVDAFPLSAYRKRSFYSMRTDAFDRFGTRLEKRFSRVQIQEMMESAGLKNIKFRYGAPYWCASGIKIGN
jgi:SAM-dependent methyltransferase